MVMIFKSYLVYIKESSNSERELLNKLYYNINMSCYLNMIFSKDNRSFIAKLRLSCHSLNIEKMRYCKTINDLVYFVLTL